MEMIQPFVARVFDLEANATGRQITQQECRGSGVAKAQDYSVWDRLNGEVSP